MLSLSQDAIARAGAIAPLIDLLQDSGCNRYIYIYIYRYVCTYIYIYTCVYIYIYTLCRHTLYIYICMYVCVYIYIHIDIGIMNTRTYIYSMLRFPCFCFDVEIQICGFSFQR